MSIIMIFVISMGSVAIGMIYGMTFLKEKTTAICSFSGSYGVGFGYDVSYHKRFKRLCFRTYVYTATIFSHVLGFIFTLFAWKEIRRCQSKETTRKQKKDIAVIRLTFCATASCLVLVVVPNGFLYYMKYGTASTVLAGFLYSAFCFRSTLNLFIFGLINSEFRRCLLLKFTTKRIEVTNQGSHTPNFDQGRVVSAGRVNPQ
ncbi:hypothetical protein L596_013823 [Steinernema carpocapsae]|uniref:G-protein coupled receptors family 1 profile domain-containing protein n=1 Tax=Steinernema carpocapsae TaxID=34508 RepID=A0A4U5P289_STECR|nr:hypothetical protein L596_013823 [Steinernema carpocapsae]